MKKILMLLFLSTLIYAGSGKANQEKILTLKKIDNKIILDGIIDEAWNLADKAELVFQLSPFYGKMPSKETYAKVLTTEDALYCLIVSYEDKDKILNQTGKQDNMNGDIVSVMLDTFGDNRTAYKFAVSASGVRSDSRMLDDARNRDYSWDGIWFSASKIYDWGYVVEIEIPYKSIQYNENISEWGLDFDRWRSIDSEDLYWCTYDQSEGQRISKFGKLIFNDFKPSVKGLNLELYPVSFGKATYIGNGKYKIDPNAGIDIFYNPSPQLTLQATANPDFAQIEADPFSFNISRYEQFFSERRPFFIQGREIFMPSGAENNSGFYRPMELFYSRRIGKILPDGKEVPISFGAKAFGRIDDWEYGGFVAKTEETDYINYNGKNSKEPNALFLSGRVKKQILENSSLGFLFVGKQTTNNTYGVLDIDGAFRGSNWQLAYQLARSIKNNQGDFAASAGFRQFTDSWGYLLRTRYVGEKFDISQVGYVPWLGTFNTVIITGPIWYPKEGLFQNIFLYGGPVINYEKIDRFTDYAFVLGISLNTRYNWGFEFNFDGGKAKDNDIEYDYFESSLSSWFYNSKFSGNFHAQFSKTYNFARNYLANFISASGSINWNATSTLRIGTSLNSWIEGNPDGEIEDITYNARPYFSLTPINDLNITVYVDNIYIRSTKKIERIFIGGLFAYQFLPKSWIYFAINEIHDRYNEFSKLQLKDRVSVFKVKYLYYF
ncbi:MAG: carbohydrate binding family 9 domain-containing protein [Melioribacteraceae bacterium]|nr:carbohydrate binding family 9 domain-containing protein [Melioribacteraceae bacterium]